jgi:hypothetical protein
MKADKPNTEEINRLKEWIEANNYTVYTVIRHVSTSGMYREISVVIPVMKDKIDVRYPALVIWKFVTEFGAKRAISTVQQFVHPSYTIAGLLNRGYSERHGHDAVICKGCGMGMGFDLVYHLSSVLYGDGYKIKQEWI